MYKELKADKKPPRSDNVGLPFGCICLVEQTIPLNPNEFPALQSNVCDLNSVLGSDSRCTWLTFTTSQNTVCWMVIQFLEKDTYKDNDTFRISEWREEDADALCREVRVFKVPGIRNRQPITLGDYIDKTSR
ncbi:hypothetical protein MVEG_08369 [Podila verticillata NRRL 6337]|nr:hypothetical protein MVEG_08369 [Podila verticillata NRRL 6337]